MAGIAQVVGMVHLPHLRPFFALQSDELHQYLEELPALDQCLAAREIQAQIRACRNTCADAAVLTRGATQEAYSYCPESGNLANSGPEQ